MDFALPDNVAANTIYYLNTKVVLASAANWASPGYEIAWSQFKVPVASTQEPVKRAQHGSLTVQEQPTRIQVKGNQFDVSFNKVTGLIDSWHFNGQKVLETAPKLNVWRALIDNDIYQTKQWKPVSNKAYWQQYGLHWLQHRLDDWQYNFDSNNKKVQVKAQVRVAPPKLAWAIKTVYTYDIFASGDIVVTVNGELVGDVPETLPRIGLQMKVPGHFNDVTWYGRGPGEAYIDSREANRIGMWQTTVDQLFTNYAVPQENGNRHEVNWMSIHGNEVGLIAVGNPQFDFSAHRYNMENIDQARHTHELNKMDEIEWNLDYKHHGLGSASCGPDVLEKYKLKADDFSFSVRFVPYSSNQDPTHIAKTIL
ncbi:hypothetical protein [Gracilibacillus boraciitolerans]|uniref:hypothetical protein n=1 Tax=Gracilibacillus boraciitolerans TaxID=307521 RepID=UPI0022857FC8|nr:hypothetical protein [Gracilibacillus boraciitolerans]